ncbi:MAG: YtxH domain-containing protein [Anaerolineaceae bacterium]
MRKFGYFLLGSLIGGVLGATIALLFTPMSGNVLRSNIQSVACNTADEIKNAALKRRGELEQQLANLRAGTSIKVE